MIQSPPVTVLKLFDDKQELFKVKVCILNTLLFY